MPRTPFVLLPVGLAWFSSNLIDFPFLVAIIIVSSPLDNLAWINWSPSLIAIAYTPPFRGLLYSDKAVLLIIPFLVAIIINWPSSNVVTGKKACRKGHNKGKQETELFHDASSDGVWVLRVRLNIT